ncbi:hypothetical protein [Hydrocarboniphaga effusa]|uniref:hypothetical protein n=1 Tax=Hydrocarboniphaga effusa TaxID=243629 RepID=UPI00398BD00F
MNQPLPAVTFERAPSTPAPVAQPLLKKGKRYVRPLSPLERFSLGLNETYRYHVDCVIEGIGDIDPARLQAAVDLAAAANPAIRVRLRGFLGFCRWVDSGRSPRVRLLPMSNWDGNSERNAPFLQERLLPLDGGPVADILVVPGADGRTRIVFRSVHAAIDGRGLMHWMLEVCRAARGEALLGSDSRLTDLDVQELNKDKLPPTPAPATPEPPKHCIPVLSPAAEGRMPVDFVWRRAILVNPSSQLLTKAAVFLAQWARKREAGDVGFTIPIDFRGLRTQEMGIGNMTGYLRLDVPPEATPRSLVSQLNQKMRDYADCRATPGIRTLLWIPIWYLLRKMRQAAEAALYTVTPSVPSGGIVSMGAMKLDEHSFPGFRATTICGIPGAVGKLNLVFLNLPATETLPPRIAVSFLVPLAYSRDGQLDALVEAFIQEFSAPNKATVSVANTASSSQ